MSARSMLALLVGRLRSRQHSSRQSLRDESYPQFYVRQLEQRRVLTVVVDAGADQQDIDEGESFTLDQVTFNDTEVESSINTEIESVEQDTGYSAQINWGDGTSSSGTVGQGTVSGTHTYADNGVYDVTVIVFGPQNQQGQDSLRVSVDNVDPILNVSADDTIDEGSSLNVFGTFTDPGFDNPLNVGGEVEETFLYSIEWGDGSTASFGAATVDTPGEAGTPTTGSFDGSHQFTMPGTYTVNVTVFDDDGGFDTQMFDVTVENIVPDVAVEHDEAVFEGSPLDITGSFTDPVFGGSENPPSATEGGDYTYTVAWGDGTDDSTGVVTDVVPGEPGGFTEGSFDASHVYADNGVYTVTVMVTDPDGGTGTTSFEVTVLNVSPTLEMIDDRVIGEGETLTIPDVGQFTDPGFDNPLNVGGEVEETFLYSIEWGDGSTASFGAATIDTPGEAGTPTAGSFDGSHQFTTPGTYTVSVTVFDDDGGMDSQTFQVVVNNTPPIVVSTENRTIDEGSPLDITNIGEFTAIDFGNLARDYGDLPDLYGTLANNDGPSHGISPEFRLGELVDAENDGMPTPGADGDDNTNLNDDDGVLFTSGLTYGQTAEVTVFASSSDGYLNAWLDVNGDGDFLDAGEQIISGELLSAGENTLTFTLPEVSPGEIGDVTTYARFRYGVESSIGPGGPALYGEVEDYQVQISIDPGAGLRAVDDEFNVNQDAVQVSLDVLANDSAGPLGGTLTVTEVSGFSAGGNATISSESILLYTPAEGFVGTETFTYSVEDNNGAVSMATVNVHVLSVNEESANGTPVISGDVAEPGGAEGATAITPTFSYIINWGDGTPADTGMATVAISPGDDGLLTGSFDGSHTYADNGVYTVTLTVIDDVYGDMGSSTFQVTVNNVSPMFVNVAGNQLLYQDEQINLEDIGVFTDPGFDNPLNVGGETEETFSFSVDWGDGTTSDFGAATVDSPGMEGVLTGGSFDGGHAYAAGGRYTVTITVFDDDGGSDVATFTVDVIPITLPPIGALPPPGGALAPIAQPEMVITPEYEPTPLATSDSSEFRPRRALTSPVAEKRYELRVVALNGEESEGIQLKDDVLDNLDSLYALLPNDHYRIYEIRPDGTERLVRDFQLRDHQPVDPAEPNEELRDLPAHQSPENDADANGKQNDVNNTETEPDGNANPDLGANFDADMSRHDSLPTDTYNTADSLLDAPQARPLDTDSSWTAVSNSSDQRLARRNPLLLYGGASLGATAAALTYNRRTAWRTRVDEAMQLAPERRITKAARIFRRVRPR